MNTLILFARLVLAGVFVVAGLAKLADLSGARKALGEFGVPKALIAPLGTMLPVLELVTGVMLLPISTVWWGGISALFLLLLFAASISINLARGKKPDCHCFGQIHSAPVGRGTLARNALLASVAGLIVWQGRYNPGSSIVGWLGDLTTAQRLGLLLGLAGLMLISAECALLFQVLRQQGRILLRLNSLEARVTNGSTAPSANTSTATAAGLPVGTPAPRFRLDGLLGETMTLDAIVAAGKPVLLLFTNPNCGPCQALLPEIGRWKREYASSLTIALISEGTAEDNRSKSVAYGLSQVLLQKEREVAEAYKAWGTPAAVLIGPDGAIGSPVAQGADAIRALVGARVALSNTPALSAAAAAAANGQTRDGFRSPRPALMTQPVVKMGDPAPALKLQDLNGNTVALADFRGRKTVLLFWNPSCGFCQQMLDDLRRWDERPPRGAPTLLLVSTGTIENNRAMRLRSAVLLDQNSQAGPAFGANGTPMAVLVDAKGQIASEVAVGAEAVCTLIGIERPFNFIATVGSKPYDIQTGEP
jgi:peroxiredoxin